MPIKVIMPAIRATAPPRPHPPPFEPVAPEVGGLAVGPLGAAFTVMLTLDEVAVPLGPVARAVRT